MKYIYAFFEALIKYSPILGLLIFAWWLGISNDVILVYPALGFISIIVIMTFWYQIKILVKDYE